MSDWIPRIVLILFLVLMGWDSFLISADPLATVASTDAGTQPTPEQLEFFEKKVRPVLVNHCYECHSSDAKSIKAGLLLDSRSGIVEGGDSGAAINKENPKESILLSAVRYEEFEMPPKGKLPEHDIEALEQWVAMGLPWPEEKFASRVSRPAEFNLEQRKADHWVWKPIENPEVPTVKNAQWPTNPIDHFVLSKLEAASVEPAAFCDKHALVRRIYLDLIGLPPTPEQVNAFVNDLSSDAVAKLVDQLLQSPQFGERWARHWLDLVRFAESRGHEFDNDARMHMNIATT